MIQKTIKLNITYCNQLNQTNTECSFAKDSGNKQNILLNNQKSMNKNGNIKNNVQSIILTDKKMSQETQVKPTKNTVIKKANNQTVNQEKKEVSFIRGNFDHIINPQKTKKEVTLII